MDSLKIIAVRKYSVLFALLALFLPHSASAQSVREVIGRLQVALDALMPFLVGLALVFFIIGVLKYIMAQDNESGRTAARQMMVNGIIALFVIVSVWGLVLVIAETINVHPGTPIGNIPQLP